MHIRQLSIGLLGDCETCPEGALTYDWSVLAAGEAEKWSL